MKKLFPLLLGIVVACVLIMPQIAWGDVQPTESPYVDIYSGLTGNHYDVELVQVTDAGNFSYNYRFKITGPIDGKGVFVPAGGGIYGADIYQGNTLTNITPQSPVLQSLSDDQFEYTFTITTTVTGAEVTSLSIALKDKQWVDPGEKIYVWHSPKILLLTCSPGAEAQCQPGSQACINGEKKYGDQSCMTPKGVLVTLMPQTAIFVTQMDTDGDGIVDIEDNCDDVASQNQTDSDNDGKGDACDEDIDGDGVLNMDDNCPLDANADQEDKDDDNFGDACDTIDDTAVVSDADLLRHEDVDIGESTQLEGATRVLSHCTLMPQAPVNLAMLPMLGLAMAAIAVIRRRK